MNHHIPSIELSLMKKFIFFYRSIALDLGKSYRKAISWCEALDKINWTIGFKICHTISFFQSIKLIGKSIVNAQPVQSCAAQRSPSNTLFISFALKFVDDKLKIWNDFAILIAHMLLTPIECHFCRQNTVKNILKLKWR